MIIGKQLIHYPTLDSTNDEARRLIKQGAGEGVVVLAGTQTRGRGKPGSRWLSPRGNLYFSAVLKPYRNPRELAPITLLGALAARALLVRVAGLPVTIKWPNDLLVHGRKIGGVLTERVPAGHLIIGIGINLQVVPRAVRRATSVKRETGRVLAPAECAVGLARELDRQYLAYLAKF